MTVGSRLLPPVVFSACFVCCDAGLLLPSKPLLVTCWIKVAPASVVLCIFCLLRRASTVQGPATEIHFCVSSCELRVASPAHARAFVPARGSQVSGFRIEVLVSDTSQSAVLYRSSSNNNGRDGSNGKSDGRNGKSDKVGMFAEFFRGRRCRYSCNAVHSLYFRWKRSLWRADFWQANKAEEDVKVQSFITLSQSFITLSFCLPGVRQCAPCWHKMPRQLKLWC